MSQKTYKHKRVTMMFYLPEETKEQIREAAWQERTDMGSLLKKEMGR